MTIHEPFFGQKQLRLKKLASLSMIYGLNRYEIKKARFSQGFSPFLRPVFLLILNAKNEHKKCESKTRTRETDKTDENSSDTALKKKHCPPCRT